MQQALDTDLLRKTISALLQHHDALRLRFEYVESTWQQRDAAFEDDVPLTIVDLASVAEDKQAAAIESAANQLQASLHISDGPLLRVAYFELGAAGQRLLIILHHLAVDGISWRILLEDLQSVYTQLQHAQSYLLPPKTTSFQEWSRKLSLAAQAATFRQELDYWTALAAHSVVGMPRDYSEGVNTVASIRMVAISLSPEETSALLHEVPQAYRTQINDILLTALAQGYAAWTGQHSLWVDMEGHGREDILEGVDLSRTVGWFTTLYPVFIEDREHNEPGTLLKQIKERLRTIPHNGIGYGLLRYLSEDASVTDRIRKISPAEISFNYLGQFDQVLGTDALFQFAQEASGIPRNPDANREHVLEVSGNISGGQLHLSWMYSANLHKDETITNFAEYCVEALRALIAHCREEQHGGYTPSDFPLAQLTQEQIDTFLPADQPIEAIYPLSPLQEGMLFHTLYQPDGGDYITQLACTFEGKLAIDVFIRAWRQVMEQHAILRTALLWEGFDQPLQVVRKQVDVPFVALDWREFTEQEQQEKLASYQQEDRASGFDLEQAPLARLTLVRMADETFVFLWSHHHILLDGWSIPLVLRDVFVCYEALHKGHDIQLPHIRPYQDYIAWLEEQDLGKAQAFWQDLLQDFTVPTPLIGEQASDLADDTDMLTYDEQVMKLSATETRILQQEARQHQLTLNTLIQGAWALLLSRYSGQDDVVFGATLSGRSASVAGIESMVGLFINTLPVRVRIPGEISVQNWLQQLQEQQSEARQYEYSPLAQVQSWSEIARGTSLFESLLVFENYPVSTSGTQGEEMSLRVQAIKSVEQANYPLSFIAIPGQELTLKLMYLRGRFGNAVIARMLQHLHIVLQSFATSLQQPVASVSVLTASEKIQLIEGWNATDTAYPRTAVLPILFEEQVSRTPEAEAIICGEQRISYAELNRQANRLAHYLRSLGVGPEIRVGLCLERSVEMLVALLGIIKAGGAYVPLDPGYPQERLSLMIEDAQITILLTHSALLEKLPPSSVQTMLLDQETKALHAQSSENPEHTVLADNLLYVMYTSGSTGKPKGVCITHQPVVRLVRNSNYIQFEPEDRIVQAANVAFDASTFELWGAWLNGACLVMVMKEDILSLPRFAQVLQEQRINTLFLTTALFNQLAREIPDVFRSLKHLLFGGEAVDVRWVHQVLAKGAPERLLHVYGPTESTTYASWHEIQSLAADATTIAIGQPLSNTTLYVLDAHMQPVPVGVAGELYIGGDGLARGYLQQPELTAERFVPHPLSTQPGARLYKTGDMVKRDEQGEIIFVGRADQQVKIRGHRIELGEIEYQLEQHPQITEALILVREGAQGDKRLVAYVEAPGASTLDGTSLRAYLQETLPDYMLPAMFVCLDAFPITPNGKIDRRALPDPDESHVSRGSDYVAPQTSVQETLAEIWCQVLGIERIGIHDNFFMLGGDSILSIQIVSRANRAGIQVSPKLLFQYQTIAALSAVVADAALQTDIVAEQGIISGDVILTPIQRWFFEQAVPQAQHYNQAMLLQVRRALDVELLKQTFDLILSHHDALRMRYQQTQGEWRQFNLAQEDQAICQVVDLAYLPAEERKQRIEAVAEEAQRSLKLQDGPLLRVVYFNPGQDEDARLLIVVHHLVIDGISWRILLEDITTAYTQLSSGSVAQLPAKTTSFQHWAMRLHEYAQSESARSDYNYWLALQDMEVSDLCDHHTGENTVASTHYVTVSLSIEETRALLQDVPQAYRTQINDVLLTAFVQAMADWTGNSALLIDMEGHGREDIIDGIDLSRTIGWFTSMYPVYLELPAATNDPGQALKAIKEQLRRIPHNGIGYGLIRYLTTAIEQRPLPEAQISFNYLGQFDQSFAQEGLFAVAPEFAGTTASEQGKRQHVLDVSCSIGGERLHFNWAYSEHLHRSESIERVALSVIAKLQALIAHCQRPEAGGYTPSDFPLASLTQAQLDALLPDKRPIESIYPLSPLQQGLLFQTLYTPESGDYVVQSSLTFRGNFNVDAFLQAWRQVVDQHAILRTSFVWEGLEEAQQIVHQHVDLPVEQQDWRALTSEQQQQKRTTYWQEDRALGFDLTHAPLLRLSILRLEDDCYEFFWSHHHLLLDGWSLPIVLNDVFACYTALAQGETVQLERSRPYQDYIGWLQKQNMAEAETHWRQNLADFTTPTALNIVPVWMPEPGYGEHVFHLSSETTLALQTLAREQHMTLNTIVQGVWALLLSQYSRQDDVIFGTTVSGRPTELADIERMVGLFINTLPVRVRLQAQQDVLSWLQELHQQQNDLRHYQYSSLAQIQGWSEVPRGVALFETLLVFENYPINTSEQATSAAIELIDGKAREQTNYPLTIYAIPGERLTFNLLFAHARFDRAAIERLVHHLQNLFQHIVEQPTQQVGAISLLSAADYQQLVTSWHDESFVYPQDVCMQQLFEQQALKTPGATALVVGEERLTYAELDRRANQLASYLQQQGVGPDVLVGVCMERSVELIVALLGVLKAGGAYVPLDPAYPKERLAFSLEDTQAPFLLTQERLLASLPEQRARIICLDRDWQEIAQERPEPVQTETTQQDLAYVIYTSGSTGKPKGVAIEHRSVIALLTWARKSFTAEELQGVLAATSVCFDLSIFEIFVPLSCGGSVILAENALQLPQLPAAQEVTLVNTVPSAMNELVRAGQLPASVRTVNLAGEPLQRALIDQLYQLPQIQQVYNLYGPTEDTTYSIWARMEEQQSRAVPIGRPLPGTQAYILDQHQQPVPVGVAGELYLGGAGLARGYLNRAELTAERFIKDPFSQQPAARLYRTGDLVRSQPDGNLIYLNRLDEQVKLRGFRIELGEVESVLRRYPGLHDVVVIVREDQPGVKRLVAYMVMENTEVLVPDMVRSFMLEHVPEYMVPTVFVVLEQLPLTPNGKIDRKALPAPEIQGSDYAAPEGATERLLVEIWQQVLGVKQVGIHDNFFTLGGDSILSLQIVSRLHQVGLHLTPKQLFQSPTIAELATLIATTDLTASSAEQGLVTGETPLTPIQHWFFAQQQPEAHYWNQAVLVSVDERLDLEALTQTVKHLLQHHDALRFRYTLHEGEWQQSNAAPDDTVPLEIYELAHQTAEERHITIEQKALVAQASLDLQNGPLMRVVYFDAGEDIAGRLLIIIHHLAVDGVSWRILLEDLVTLYMQLSQQQTVQLPAKTTSFQQWAQQLVQYAQQPEVKAQLDYWLAADLNTVSALPVDYRRGENTVASTQSVVVSLSREETQILLREVPQAYRTQINDVLLTALAQGLAQWTGQRKVLIDLEGHGREDILAGIDLSRTVGWFTSLYPLLLDRGEQTDDGQMLKSIKEQLRAVPQNGLSYGLLRYLLEDSQIRERLAAQPKAEIIFNYLGQFDQAMSQSGLIGPASESSGSAISLQGQRHYLFEINSSISSGQLNLAWAYSANLHQHETVQGLANAVLAALRRLIEHCQQPEAGGYTPSDFPLAHLTQTQIERVLDQDRSVEAVYPLSPMQQGLLFHTLYAPEAGDYIIQFRSTFKGHLDVEAFSQAWQHVVSHHTILRTSFQWEELSDPVQIVHQHLQVPFVLLDWQHYDAEEQQKHLATYLSSDREQGFELSRAPLMRLTLLRLSDDSYEFIWSHHHILLDGWSLPIVLNDVFICYEALRLGKPLQLAAIRPYQDYIAWLQQQDLEQAERFWKHTLAGFSVPTPLTVDRPLQNSEQGYEEHVLSIPETMTQSLQQLARQHQLTLNTIAQGAWAFVLIRYSGQSDIVFGAVVSGRPAEVSSIEAMVGLFINTLPVRVNIAEDESVIDWLQELQRQQSEMRQYEYSPLVQVQNWSEIPRGSALFESLFIFENYPISSSVEGGEESLQILKVDSQEQTNYPLTLVVLPGAQLSVRIQYDRQRFDARTIQRLAGHIQTVLESFVRQSEQQLAHLSMLTTAEQQHLTAAWNAIEMISAPQYCLHQLFEQQVAQQPTATAVRYENQSLTYEQLNNRANQLAHYLRSLGIGPDILVGLALERSLEMVIGILGILKAGGAYVPIDPMYPKERLAFLLEDASVPVLVTQQNLLERLPAYAGHVVCFDTDQQLLEQQVQTNPDWEASLQQLAYVIYTSGSTGKPKGVLVEHKHVARLFSATQPWYNFGPDDVWTLFHSYAFDFSVWELWGSLLYGGTLVVVPYWMSRSPQDFYTLLQKEKVTVLNQTPSAFRQLQQVALTTAHEQSLTELRYVIFGGEALELQSLHPWFERFGDQQPQLVNMYGITETTVHVTYRPITMVDVEAGTGSVIGRAIPDLSVYVLDQRQRPVPIGVAGELYVGGAGVARGYLNRPALTDERFIRDPFSQQPAARLYRTGDLARYHENGDLEYMGRIDEQVKIRGFRIELGEIEGQITQHPDIQECIVIAREDTPGNKRLVAYVVLQPEVSTTGSDIRAYLQERLPEYMVPVAFILLEKLPLNANGKIDRRALPAPDQSHLALDRAERISPQNEKERVLAQIWQHVLGVEQIGIHDDFFALGGDSILSIQIVARSQQAGLKLTPKLLFQHPTLADLAAHVETAPQIEREQGIVSGDVQITPIQRWFFEQQQPDPHYWNQAVLLSVRTALQVELLEHVARAVLQQHDALRLRYTRQPDGSWQAFNQVDEPAQVFAYHDLSALAPADQPLAVEASALAVQASLNIETGPIIRMVYFKLGEDVPGRLLVVIHHLAVDGVSWRILLEDVQTAYEHLSQNKEIVFPAKTTSFRQWSQQLYDHAQSTAMRHELQYWLAQGRQQLAALPVDQRTGSNSIRSSRTYAISLTHEETHQLLHEVPQRYHTQINDVLLTALAHALTKWTGQSAVRVHLEGHGREEIIEGLDLSRTVGWFTSLYPVILAVADAQQPVETLKSMKEYLRGIPQRGIGYGLLRYLCTDSTTIEQLKSLPEAEVSFNYLGQFDQTVSQETLFGPAHESSGLPVSIDNQRQHLLDINGSIVGGQLQLAWSYSSNFHLDGTIATVAQDYLHTLRQIIAQIHNKETIEFTPSDFPEAELNQKELDKIVTKLRRKKGK
ncbi:hypothetical protein KDW_43550 [Dictyobacter vulcani]|uniref:Carrier domain-containing protein n=1 Tax=Dictyobacter vulcani TaxID=2607529 RepID=A0A5J4KRD3_9CHLR|nr:hypothetical protein KDW_43550 [Dictyobacter vulcani]